MDPETLGPLFARPQDPNRLWILILAFSLPTIFLAGVALVRGRLLTSLPSGLLLLPVFGYVLGDLLILEESKRVGFCGSCHETMGPLVESLGGGSPSLAAFHFQRGAISHETACYECHSGYGIWGDLRAKRAGFQHMINTVIGRYHFPLETAGAVDLDACLSCHAEAKPFRAAEAHHDPDLQRMLLGGQLGCTGACHQDAHPADSLNGASAR
jgi:cytochrome c nitrite reductase small subunit